MSGTWSVWREEEGRRMRNCIDAVGSHYTQYDSENAPIYDANRNIISPAAALVLGLSLDLMPRSTQATPTFFTQPTDQIDTEIATSSENFEYGKGVPADEDAYEEGDDDITDLPDNKLFLVKSAMAKKPLTGKAKTDLQSVKTSGSLPAGYFVRGSEFFRLGTVFRVLWVEAKGTTAKNYKGDGEVYKTLRPMIVVSRRKSHCICAPIFSYGSQGVGKSGLVEAEIQHHAVVQMEGNPASLMPAELHWGTKIKLKDAFTIKPASETSSLSASSRVRFDTTYPVRYNLKVLSLGRVIETDRARLQHRWRAANSS